MIENILEKVKRIQNATVVGRVKFFVDSLEDEFEELPEGYKDRKKEFMAVLGEYSFVNVMYIIISLVFYASIVTSVTATIGFEIDIFSELYSILGFTTAGAIYLIFMYLRKLARADLENHRVKLVSYMYSYGEIES